MTIPHREQLYHNTMCYFHAFDLQLNAFGNNQENKDSEEIWD